MKQLSLASALVVMLLLATAPAYGTTQVSKSISMMAHGNFQTTTSGCENSPGPYITLKGEISLGGLGVELIFKNNEKGTHTHTEDATANVVVVPAGETIQFPKQPVLGGVGGNPWIFLQILDGKGNALTGETLLGRCVQGLFNMSADFFIPATATADVAVGSCSNKGPEITLTGELALTGINAKLTFKNNMDGTHDHEEPTSVSVVIIPAGQEVQFPKQPVLGGVGGNPWILLQFLDGKNQPIGSEFLLGRCVQLSQQ